MGLGDLICSSGISVHSVLPTHAELRSVYIVGPMLFLYIRSMKLKFALLFTDTEVYDILHQDETSL